MEGESFVKDDQIIKTIFGHFRSDGNPGPIKENTYETGEKFHFRSAGCDFLERVAGAQHSYAFPKWRFWDRANYSERTGVYILPAAG